MHRDVILDCLPFLALMAASVVVGRLLISACGARLQLAQLKELHRDQQGAVQSLSFVLTLPVFVMLMLFVVQLSQLTIARLAVEYAAYAAARSAIVWIPANLGDDFETPNRIGTRISVGETQDEFGNYFDVYEISGPSRKLDKMHLAAAMAMMPVCPSREVGADASHPGNGAIPSLESAYAALSPSSTANTRIPTRLRNKLAYALQSTQVSLEVRHRQDEPPLVWHEVRPYDLEFEPNEIGWQDQLLLTVTHQFALLPGPGRFLARRVLAPGATTDEVADRIQQHPSGVFVYPLSATVRLSNEGEKPVLPFIQHYDIPRFESLPQ